MGTRIMEARQEAGLTREQLAVAVGIASATLRSYELHKTHPRVDMLEAIARETKRPLSYFTETVAA